MSAPNYEATPGRFIRRADLIVRLSDELKRAYEKHGCEPWGRHEFYAILLEEVEEVWDAIKRDLPQAELEKEIVQVAAMCFRYFETGDRYRTLPGEVRADGAAALHGLAYAADGHLLSPTELRFMAQTPGSGGSDR